MLYPVVMTCPQCGVLIAIGDWPYCPHGSVFPESARRFDPIVVWQSNTDPNHYSGWGARTNEPVPEGFHKVEITNIRQADQLVRKVNDIERQKMEEARRMRYALDDAGVTDRRREEDARGWVMRADGTKFYVRGNSRAEALRRRAREYTDAERARRRAQHPRIDPQFHSQVLSFDSGNRSSYSGPETG